MLFVTSLWNKAWTEAKATGQSSTPISLCDETIMLLDKKVASGPRKSIYPFNFMIPFQSTNTITTGRPRVARAVLQTDKQTIKLRRKLQAEIRNALKPWSSISDIHCWPHHLNHVTSTFNNLKLSYRPFLTQAIKNWELFFFGWKEINIIFYINIISLNKKIIN